MRIPLGELHSIPSVKVLGNSNYWVIDKVMTCFCNEKQKIYHDFFDNPIIIKNLTGKHRTR